MAEGEPPFKDLPVLKALLTITTRPPSTLKKKSDWSEAMKDFLAKCLAANLRRGLCRTIARASFYGESLHTEEFAEFVKDSEKKKKSKN